MPVPQTFDVSVMGAFENFDGNFRENVPESVTEWKDFGNHPFPTTDFVTTTSISTQVRTTMANGFSITPILSLIYILII